MCYSFRVKNSQRSPFFSASCWAWPLNKICPFTGTCLFTGTSTLYRETSTRLLYTHITGRILHRDDCFDAPDNPLKTANLNSWQIGSSSYCLNFKLTAGEAFAQSYSDERDWHARFYRNYILRVEYAAKRRVDKGSTRRVGWACMYLGSVYSVYISRYNVADAAWNDTSADKLTAFIFSFTLHSSPVNRWFRALLVSGRDRSSFCDSSISQFRVDMPLVSHFQAGKLGCFRFDWLLSCYVDEYVTSIWSIGAN